MRNNSTQSFVTSHQYSLLLPTFLGCVQAVYKQRTSGRINHIFIPFSDFCTNFVRNLWLSFGYYTRVILATYPLLFPTFVSVNTDLYPLPTGLTINYYSYMKLNNRN